MADFIFSAFSDEITSDFDGQIAAVKKLGIPMIELRGVDGKSFINLTDSEVETVRAKLDSAGIKLSALGTPLGKITLDDDFEAHLALLDRIMDIGDALGCKRLRIFSFYRGADKTDKQFREGAISRLSAMLDKAVPRGFVLCHENEKDIYGETPERVLELMQAFGGRLKVVLDSGNFAFCGVDAAPAYGMLKEFIEYLHIKDAEGDGLIVPPGKGKARLEETLDAVAKDFAGKQVILTMEPHLMVFTGLSTFSNVDEIKHKYTFESPFHAFEYAYNAVKSMRVFQN